MNIFTNRLLSLPALFVYSVFLWLYCFRGHLTQELAFVSDAVSYYDHIKFFIENLAQGTFAVWDPFWHAGSPNEFFLRRFNGYNPFFYLIVVLIKAGVSYTTSYLIFLSFYFFLGAFGFFKLVRCIYDDERIAFAAFLLVYFSSLATRLFDSFLIFEFTPYAWFFYFWAAFTREKRRHQLLGLTFSLMIILTTYIPFYFLTILITFLACFLLFFPKVAFKTLKAYFDYTIRHKLFVLFCAAAVSVSLFPGLNMIKQGKGGGIAMPHRHSASSEENVMTVGKETVVSWGMLEDLTYSYAFKDLRKFKFAILYVPIFAFIVLLLGMITAMNKRLVFYFVWGFLIFICHSPHAPVYGFFYEHIFYYKYFRNLHFFLWLILMQIFILFAADFLWTLFRRTFSTQFDKKLFIGYICLAHIAALAFLWKQGDAITGSYAVAVLSWIFFIMLVHRPLRIMPYVNAAFLVLCVAQPLEVYGYFNRNELRYQYRYPYEKPLTTFAYTRGEKGQELTGKEAATFRADTPYRIHYGVGAYAQLSETLSKRLLEHYLHYKFRIYDRVEPMDSGNVDIARLGKAFYLNENVAFLKPEDTAFFRAAERHIHKGVKEWRSGGVESRTDSSESGENREAASVVVLGSTAAFRPEGEIPSSAEIITKDSEKFMLLDYNANTIRFKTDFPYNAFLVYTDNYHKDWRAQINGEEAKVYRANVSFKGVFLPSGENVVSMVFGTGKDRLVRYSLIVVFNAVLICLILSWHIEQKGKKSYA